jgi:F0F1-type ATP synthase membrane subunit b/b'
MFAFISNSILLLAETHGAAAPASGFTKFYNEYLNIPGFEAWKFINLAIFIAIMVYVLKKPLGEAFRARRDQIRAELIKAEQEKQAALLQLTTAEGKLAQLPNEKETILREAKEEAEAEKRRLAENAESEGERLRRQAEAELARLAGQTRKELRRLSAEKTVTFAEQKLRSAIDGSVDARLVQGSLSEIGGLN